MRDTWGEGSVAGEGNDTKARLITLEEKTQRIKQMLKKLCEDTDNSCPKTDCPDDMNTDATLRIHRGAGQKSTTDTPKI
ncbi:uncharacterized protein RCO7_14605 [Rhynchosporium graminicola]|uniref:Uncharacterized protein n=1 Tax=Rhynchosporium graminicola TaxID=2792576 RepID=A0A1E1KQY5_9HELO|nr:uncharacterized protein RCO7_14605 [Rhynchosporium commune]